MPENAFSITIHMVSSLDGIIAKKDNSVSWFETTSPYPNGAEAPNVEEFLKTIDCYVMGARTYEHALELSRSYGWAYGDIPTFVLSHRELPIERPNIRIVSGDLAAFVNRRLKPNYTNVWVVGGAMVANDFMRAKLANGLRLTIVPVILGEGIKLFSESGQEAALDVKGITAYKNGLVELYYQLRH